MERERRRESGRERERERDGRGATAILTIDDRNSGAQLGPGVCFREGQEHSGDCEK